MDEERKTGIREDEGVFMEGGRWWCVIGVVASSEGFGRRKGWSKEGWQQPAG